MRSHLFHLLCSVLLLTADYDALPICALDELRIFVHRLGAWTGTILCSPTLLGTNLGLMLRRSNGGDNESLTDSTHGSMGSLSMASSSWRGRDKQVRKNGTGALLFF
jgi:hypothetical protein